MDIFSPRYFATTNPPCLHQELDSQTLDTGQLVLHQNNKIKSVKMSVFTFCSLNNILPLIRSVSAVFKRIREHFPIVLSKSPE